jgi:hypothetical protein
MINYRISLTASLTLLLLLAACSSQSTEPQPPPTLTTIGARSTAEGLQLIFGVAGSNADGTAPELTAAPLPMGAVFADNLDGTGVFDWTPTLSQAGTYPVMFRAAHGSLADSELVLINVTDAGGGPAPRDTVWISTDTVSAGDTAVVQLNLSNPDTAVASLNIWLKSSSSDVRYDTTAPLLPRFPTGMTWSSQRQDSINAMSVLMVDFTIPIAVIAPGSGPLMEIRFVVSPTATPGTYTVDTTSLVLPKAVDISYPSGLSVPDVGFVPGQIVVQ